MSASSTSALSRNLAFGERCVNFFRSGMVVEFCQIPFLYLLLMTIRFFHYFFNALLEEYFLFANTWIKILALVFMDDISPCHFQFKVVLRRAYCGILSCLFAPL